MSFQACKANRPEVEAHKTPFVTVEEKAIEIIVKATWKHRKRVINARNAIGSRQLFLKRACDACFA